MTFPILGGNGAVAGYEIDNSLRFNDGDSPDLRKTFSSAGNRKTWTWSGWVKRTRLTGVVDSVFAGFTDINNRLRFNFLGDQIEIFGKISGTTVQLVTTQVFRDTSAWYHFVWVMDTEQATASNRMKLYLNGEQITDFSSTNYPAQNAQSVINNNTGHFIGQRGDGASQLDGYIAEYHFIDGTVKSPTDFGEYDESGIWKPIEYTGSYGTNGFYLDFSNSSTLGEDFSGNDNDFTATNLASTDQTTDTPTNNFCTLNFNDAVDSEGSDYNVTGLLSEGNLDFKGGGAGTGDDAIRGTIGISSGKWYLESKIVDNTKA